MTGGEVTPDAGQPAAPAVARFRFPLPVDPARLLGGVLSRWPWIVAGLVAVGALGAGLGKRTTHPSYTLSVSLIKRRVPHTVQTSEAGQAYRPVDLNDATLLATLTATEPLDLTLQQAKNNLDPKKVRSLVEAKQLEGTDIFYITYHSPISAVDAVAFTTIWAAEINAYTQRLQQNEAREVLIILQKEVTGLEQKIADTNLEILNFSKEKDYLGGEAQVAAALSRLSQIELQLETARTTAAAKEQQLKNYTEQIRRQSPIELQLKTAKEELAHLRASYTDANPLVQTKLQSIEYLNEQIGKLGENGKTDLESYTGTPLGNSLYLSILGLRNEQFEAQNQIESLEKLYRKTAGRLEEFPAIVNDYAALQKKAASISQSLTLMSNRLKEAEIFASGAPGYWQVFQAPDPRLIIPSSVVKRPALLGIAGGLLGAGIATLLTLLLSHRSVRRSVLECCVATRAPLVADIPTSDADQAHAAMKHFWITRLAPLTSAGDPLLLWTPALEAADERRFWSLLAEAAWTDTGLPVRVCDLTPDDLWNDGPACPEFLDWSTQEPVSPPSNKTIAATLLRAAALPHGDARLALGRVHRWLAVVAGHKDSLGRAARFRQLSDAYLPPCGGTIAWTAALNGRIRTTADLLSAFLTKRFS